jgi:hypothetical protein
VKADFVRSEPLRTSWPDHWFSPIHHAQSVVARALKHPAAPSRSGVSSCSLTEDRCSTAQPELVCPPSWAMFPGPGDPHHIALSSPSAAGCAPYSRAVPLAELAMTLPITTYRVRSEGFLLKNVPSKISSPPSSLDPVACRPSGWPSVPVTTLPASPEPPPPTLAFQSTADLQIQWMPTMQRPPSRYSGVLPPTRLTTSLPAYQPTTRPSDRVTTLPRNFLFRLADAELGEEQLLTLDPSITTSVFVLFDCANFTDLCMLQQAGTVPRHPTSNTELSRAYCEKRGRACVTAIHQERFPDYTATDPFEGYAASSLGREGCLCDKHCRTHAPGYTAEGGGECRLRAPAPAAGSEATAPGRCISRAQTVQFSNLLDGMIDTTGILTALPVQRCFPVPRRFPEPAFSVEFLVLSMGLMRGPIPPVLIDVPTQRNPGTQDAPGTLRVPVHLVLSATCSLCSARSWWTVSTPQSRYPGRPRHPPCSRTTCSLCAAWSWWTIQSRHLSQFL